SAEHQPFSIRRREETREFLIEQRPLRRTGDQPPGAVPPERRDVMLGKTAARALHLLRIPTGDVDDRRRSADAGSTETATPTMDEQQRQEGQQAFHPRNENTRTSATQAGTE